MRHIFIFLVGVITMTGCATPKPASSAASKQFRLVSVERPEPKRAKGVFTFTNTTGRPLRVSGFDSPDDGEFQIRFTRYQFQTPKGWQDLHIGYCGTGAQDFVLQPGRTYKIREWLDTYGWLTSQTGGTATVGRIALPTLRGYPEIWSEPFTIPTLR